MLNIELNDTEIKTIMVIIAVAVLAVILFVVAPKAYQATQTNEQAVSQEHKVWLAANINKDAEADVYY